MFREIARKKQALSHEACVRLLRQERRAVLSVVTEDGYPYAVPVNHWYNPEDGKLYFHGGKLGHKIDCMRPTTGCRSASWTAGPLPRTAGGRS